MTDPRLSPQHLLAVGRFFEINGDGLSAVKAYRDVVLSDDPIAAAEARRRLDLLAWPRQRC